MTDGERTERAPDLDEQIREYFLGRVGASLAKLYGSRHPRARLWAQMFEELIDAAGEMDGDEIARAYHRIKRQIPDFEE